MSRVKRFTLGPWEAKGSCVKRPNGEILTCFVDGFVRRGSSLEDYETARLVAVAPDLLEALEGAQRHLKGYRETVAQWKRQCEPETDDLDIEDVGHLDEELAALDAQIEENERVISKAYGEEA